MTKKSVGMDKLLELFQDHISVADVLSARGMSEISSAIAKRRLELGMTQKDFAEYMGVSQAMVSKWEGGDYNFSVKSLAEVAEKLDLDMQIKLRQYKSNVEINHLKENNLAYSSFQTSNYRGYKSGIISFSEKSNQIKHKRNKMLEG